MTSGLKFFPIKFYYHLKNFFFLKTLNNKMSSTTLSRYRETSNCDQNNTSLTDEYALDVIAKEVCIKLIFYSHFFFIIKGRTSSSIST